MRYLEEKDGGLTGYRMEVVYQQGPVRFRGAVHVPLATGKEPVALEVSTCFAALAYPIAMEITLPPKVSKDLARAIARAVERGGGKKGPRHRSLRQAPCTPVRNIKERDTRTDAATSAHGNRRREMNA